MRRACLMRSFPHRSYLSLHAICGSGKQRKTCIDVRYYSGTVSVLAGRCHHFIPSKPAPGSHIRSNIKWFRSFFVPAPKRSTLGLVSIVRACPEEEKKRKAQKSGASARWGVAREKLLFVRSWRSRLKLKRIEGASNTPNLGSYCGSGTKEPSPDALRDRWSNYDDGTAGARGALRAPWPGDKQRTINEESFEIRRRDHRSLL